LPASAVQGAANTKTIEIAKITLSLCMVASLPSLL
jgi:hypothetical protein